MIEKIKQTKTSFADFMEKTTALLSGSMFTQEELRTFLYSDSEDDFYVLYDIYAAPLFGIVLKMVKCNAKAEHILASTFIKARKEALSFDDCPFSLFIWLMRIAVQLCLQEKKSNGIAQVKEDILTTLSFAPKHERLVNLGFSN